MSTRPTTDAQRLAGLEASLALAGPPRAAQGGAAARSALIRAQALAGMVRDEGPDSIGAYLDDLTPDQLYALVVALAAMVPLDVPVEGLLGWLEPLGRRLEAAAQARRRDEAAA